MGEESWILDRAALPGDTSRPEPWAALDEAREAQDRHPAGRLEISDTERGRGYVHIPTPTGPTRSWLSLEDAAPEDRGARLLVLAHAALRLLNPKLEPVELERRVRGEVPPAPLHHVATMPDAPGGVAASVTAERLVMPPRERMAGTL